jgi:hypothetical protein
VGELFFVWACEPAPVGELFLYGTARTSRISLVGDFFYVGGLAPKDFLPPGKSLRTFPDNVVHIRKCTAILGNSLKGLSQIIS